MKQFVKTNRYSLLLIVLFTVSIVLFSTNITPSLQGDGKEYMMQAIAFGNHFDFGITEADVNETMETFPLYSEVIKDEYYTNQWDHLHEYGSAKYCNHYGSYSALVAPVLSILQLIDIDPIWAFCIANFLMWIAALLVILFYLKTDSLKRFCILLLLTINPALFYLYWTHAEVYIYSFEIIGLVFFYNKQYARSILFLCIASMQNMALLIFAMMVGIDYIIECILKYREKHQAFLFLDFIKEYWKQILPYGLCYIPGFAPIVSTYMKFHTFNLVAEVARENKYLFHKAFGYLFDLNLGIFPFEPIILILFLAMMIAGVRRCTRMTLINAVGVSGILYVISNQVQINCGMQAIMRYNVWIIPILIFYVLMNWNFFFNNSVGMKFVSVSETFIVLILIGYMTIGNGRYGYNQFAPWTKAVMNIFPQSYNPTHGIFYSRALGYESYYSKVPVIYKAQEGYIRKILLSKEAEDTFYSDEFKLSDADGNMLDKNKLKTRKVDSGEYMYINCTGNVIIPPFYTLGDTIYFTARNNNADVYFTEGLSHPEEWGRWSDGDRLVGNFWIEKQSVKMLNACIHIHSIFYCPQEVTILANDVEVFHGIVEGDEDIQFTFENSNNGKIQLTFLLPNSVRPSEVTESNDKRALGIGLDKMVITESHIP